MARKLSRRALAQYVADTLTEANRKTVVQQLAAYLVETRRTKELTLIIRDVTYFLAQKGVVNATVTSAFKLSAETQQAIKKFVASQTDAKSVTVTNQTDPSVLGGFKVSLPGAELDQTVAHQLTVLKTRFKKA